MGPPAPLLAGKHLGGLPDAWRLNTGCIPLWTPELITLTSIKENPTDAHMRRHWQVCLQCPEGLPDTWRTDTGCTPH